MATFGDLHRDAIAGTIGTRLIFKGHVNALFPQGAFKRYLDRRGILLKDAGSFFEVETARLKAHAKALADDHGRPFIYLNAAQTHATGSSKESLARRIAAQDGVTEGVSSAAGLHRHALSEPDVTLSRHPAPLIQPPRPDESASNGQTMQVPVLRRDPAIAVPSAGVPGIACISCRPIGPDSGQC